MIRFNRMVQICSVAAVANDGKAKYKLPSAYISTTTLHHPLQLYPVVVVYALDTEGSQELECSLVVIDKSWLSGAT